MRSLHEVFMFVLAVIEKRIMLTTIGGKWGRYCLIITIYALCAHPQSHSFAGEYYVSSNASGGDGTRGNPWGPAEIKWTILSSANNTLYFAGGTYTTSFSISHNTESYRLNIKPGSAAPDPTGIDGLVLFQRGAPANLAAPSYVFYVTGYNTTIDGRKSATDSTINMRLVPGNNHGVVFPQNRRGNVIQYLEITGMADEQTYCGGGACQVYAIDAQIQGTGVEIANNYIHNNHGSGDIAVSGNDNVYGLIKVHHNTIAASTVNHVMGSLRGVDFYNNTSDVTGARLIYDNMHIYSSSGIRYIRIFNNTFINTGTASDQVIFVENASRIGEKTEHLRIYNNVFLNKKKGTGYSRGVALENCDSDGGVDDVYIVNNTFEGDGTLFLPIRMYASPHVSSYTNFKIENNIFSETSGPTIETGVTWANEADSVFDYNVIYHSTNITFKWLSAPGGVVKAYTTVCSIGCDWIKDHPLLASNIDKHPVLSSTSLKLQAASPAIDAGKDLSVYPDMDATKDILGNPRIGKWDIGAHESITDKILPSTPQGVRIL